MKYFFSKTDTSSFGWGIHYIKFICLALLCYVHAVSWICEAQSITFGQLSILKLGNILAFSVIVAMLFPSLAGMTFFTTYKQNNTRPFSSSSNSKLRDKEVLRISLFLFTCEAIKYAVTYGWMHLFYWGALQTAAISFIVIHYLYKKNILLIFLSMIASAVAAEFLQKTFGLAQVSTQDFTASFIYPNIINFVYSGLIAIIYFYALFRLKFSFGKNKRRTVLLITLGALILFMYTATFTNYDSRAIWSLKTYLLGSLIGDTQSLHLYPLLVWYPKICAGFILFYFIYKVFNYRQSYLFLSIGSILLYFFFDKLTPPQTRMAMLETHQNSIHAWDSGLINDTYDNMSTIIIFLTLCGFCLILGFVESLKLKFDATIVEISRGSLWIYLFVTGPGHHIIFYIGSRMDFKNALAIAMLVLFLISYIIAKIALLISKNKYFLTIRKVG